MHPHHKLPNWTQNKTQCPSSSSSHLNLTLFLVCENVSTELVRSIVFGDSGIPNNPLLLSQNHHFLQNANLDDDGDNHPSNTTVSAYSRNRIPLMLFVPTQELVKDTYRLAKIARDIGMDLNFKDILLLSDGRPQGEEFAMAICASIWLLGSKGTATRLLDGFLENPRNEDAEQEGSIKS